MFSSHRSFFKLAYEETLGDKKYLFTHAGLILGWYEKYKDIIGDLTVDNLNNLLTFPRGFATLNDVPYSRWGSCPYGSIVWNDVDDFYEGVNKNLPWDNQIFGHTQQEENPIITKEYACLDCRKAFILNEDGGFQEA